VILSHSIKAVLISLVSLNLAQAQAPATGKPAPAPVAAPTATPSSTAPTAPAATPTVTQAGGATGKSNSGADLPRPVLNTKRPVKIFYKVGRPDGNLVIIVRDAKSGRMAKMDLQTYNESTQSLEGSFSINFVENEQTIIPEVYVVPSSLVNASDQYKKIEQLIKDEALLRKPFFLRLDDKNSQNITVFDSRDQVLQAFEEYRKAPSGKDVVDKAALEAAKAAAMAAEKARLEALKLAQEQQRLALAELEKKRIEDLRKQQAELAEAEKERRRRLAEETVLAALKAYKAENYPLAEKKFAESIQLDPSNEKYFFQLGVTQYKLGEYNDSLVSLQQATKGEFNPLERSYFMALNYMKLKETDNARREFTKVKDGNEKGLSATAAFFAGVIDFTRESYDDAKSNFEYVLDNSDDKSMDAQAEAYIEQIIAIKAFEAEQKKTFIFSVNGGLIYDSNLLNTAPSLVASSATGLSGWRGLWSLGAEYRPVYLMSHELSLSLNYSDMYSYNSSFQKEATFQNTDPMVIGITIPYKYKGMLLGKGYQATVSLISETTSMNADGAGAREKVLGSSAVKVDQTFVMNDDWFSTYSLELRQDTPGSVTSEIDDSTASKTTLSTNQTFFQDKKKTEAYIGDFSYAMNAAKGDNADYTKMDIGLLYMMPFYYESSLSSRVGLTSNDYTNHAQNKKDTTVNLLVAWRKPTSELTAWTVSLGSTTNTSTVETSSYNKLMLTVLYSWTPSF
jgi:hypothetical protein